MIWMSTTSRGDPPASGKAVVERAEAIDGRACIAIRKEDGGLTYVRLNAADLLALERQPA